MVPVIIETNLMPKRLLRILSQSNTRLYKNPAIYTKTDISGKELPVFHIVTTSSQKFSGNLQAVTLQVTHRSATAVQIVSKKPTYNNRHHRQNYILLKTATTTCHLCHLTVIIHDSRVMNKISLFSIMPERF